MMIDWSARLRGIAWFECAHSNFRFDISDSIKQTRAVMDRAFGKDDRAAYLPSRYIDKSFNL